MDDGALVLIAAAGAWFLTRAKTGSSLQFLPLGVNGASGGLVITIGVQNPTSNSLTLNSFAGEVYINGTATGNVSDFTQRVIAANSQTPVDLTFVPSAIGVLSDILNLINNGNGLNLSIKGTANINGIPVSVNIQFQAVPA